MYNRYVPQPDGSFCRNRMDSNQETQKEPPRKPEKHDPTPPKHKEQPIGGFFQNLLPKGLDTGDLIVILLLLLLSADCEEDHSTAMLTLAIYLFM